MFPGLPQNVSLSACGSRCLRVAWQPPGSADASAHELLRYELVVSGDQEGDTRVVNISPHSVVATFRNLRLGARLVAKVRAVASAGPSTWVDGASSVTVIHPPSAPHKLSVDLAHAASPAQLSRSLPRSSFAEKPSGGTSGGDEDARAWVKISWARPLETGSGDDSRAVAYELVQTLVETEETQSGPAARAVSTNPNVLTSFASAAQAPAEEGRCLDEKLVSVLHEHQVIDHHSEVHTSAYVLKGCVYTWRVRAINAAGACGRGQGVARRHAFRHN